MQAPAMPAPEEIALLEPFERIGLDRIRLVATTAQAEAAADVLLRAPVWGFDTESRPTFNAGEASQGPHIVQLAMPGEVFIFQLHERGCADIAGHLLAQAGIIKA
ncbi:MAG: 3'-5' exonuclease domain-containing protein 2, partial [Comamonadaceae bacterium]